MPGKSHGLRSLVGYSPWGCKESDTTEQLHFHFPFQLSLHRVTLYSPYNYFLNEKKIHQLFVRAVIGLDACMLSYFSRVQLCATLWTVAHLALLSMEFSRQENWSGLPFPPPGDLPGPEMELTCPMSPVLAGGFFTTSATWEAQ